MKAGTLLAPLKALIRLHWMLLCIVAGLILLYALAGFFLVPYLARSQLESYVTQTLHRQVSVGDVRFNPFFLDTSIHDFQLSEADGTPLISFRHLYVNAELASLWRRAIVLKEVQLAKPNFELVIERDGSVNLARLVPESAIARTRGALTGRTGPDRFSAALARPYEHYYKKLAAGAVHLQSGSRDFRRFSDSNQP